ncbi:putative short-chain dehydrogenase/reductase SDR, NAD(P)-binding domain superfamily [Plasmopara halstedii]
MSKKLLVVGGAGALGRGVVSHFARASWTVTSVDFTESADAHANVLLSRNNSLELAKQTLDDISSRCGKLNTVVCTAGGWAGGSIRDANSLINLREMHVKNLESAFLTTYLASHLLVPGGLLVLTGATAALCATPGMVSYGASKAATHHLIASAVELPEGSSVLGVLPITIDTPVNRKFMAKADLSTWTKVEDIAEKIQEWSEATYATRPPSGHLITVTTEYGTTSWKDIDNSFQ